MELDSLIEELREEASDIGLFFPLQYDADALETEGSLHGHAVANRSVLLMQSAQDATAEGASSEDTVRRYCDAIREKADGIVGPKTWEDLLALAKV